MLDLNQNNRFRIENQKNVATEFDKINSMTNYFYKIYEVSGSSYVKFRLRSSAVLNIENDDEICFLFSILAQLQPCKKIILTEYRNMDKLLMT